MQTLWTRSHRSTALPGIFISAIGILGFAIGRSAPQLFNLLPPCLFHHKTGIPCPSCGATRAAIYLCHFSFVQALWANPFFTLFFLALAFWGFASLVTLISGRR
ncbi:DUF2752 domain-containing protein, partial [candidate division KSB1 bacterium]|nr:DUF2752 domain-containing protein [candidate division KSB1 bacterium]